MELGAREASWKEAHSLGRDGLGSGHIDSSSRGREASWKAASKCEARGRRGGAGQTWAGKMVGVECKG